MRFDTDRSSVDLMQLNMFFNAMLYHPKYEKPEVVMLEFSEPGAAIVFQAHE